MSALPTVTTGPLARYGAARELIALVDTFQGLEAGDPGRDAIKAQLMPVLLANVDAFWEALTEFESNGKIAKAEKQAADLRRGACERIGEKVAAAIQAAMEILGADKVEGEASALKLQANPPSVIITDLEQIPAAYRTIVPETWTPNKSEIAKALKAGVVVPGADLSEGKRLVWK